MAYNNFKSKQLIAKKNCFMSASCSNHMITSSVKPFLFPKNQNVSDVKRRFELIKLENTGPGELLVKVIHPFRFKGSTIFTNDNISKNTKLT